MWPETQLYQLTVVVQVSVDQTFESRGQKATTSVNSLAVNFLKPEDYLNHLPTFSCHCTPVSAVDGSSVRNW